MSRSTTTLSVRLSDRENLKLNQYAEKNRVTKTKVIKKLIKEL